MYFGITWSKEKTKFTEEIQKIKDENVNLSKQMEDLNKKNENESDTEKDISQKEDTAISQEDVKKITEDFLNLRMICFASSEGVLCSKYLNFYSDYAEMDKHLTRNDRGNQTDIKYDDFKNKMLSYMTEELFLSDNVFKTYENNNGMLFVLFGGASGGEYKITDVKLISNTGGLLEYSYNGVFSFSRDENISGKVTIKKSNDKYVVSSYDVPKEF